VNRSLWGANILFISSQAKQPTVLIGLDVRQVGDIRPALRARHSPLQRELAISAGRATAATLPRPGKAGAVAPGGQNVVPTWTAALGMSSRALSSLGRSRSAPLQSSSKTFSCGTV